MKLDPAFLFISISTFLTLYRAYEPNNSEKQNVSYILLAGILIGFAFSVKFTALMLIIMGPAYIAYRLLSVSGFFGFFFLFLATFTKLGLWKQMNVWLPLDKPGLLTAASALMLAISIFSFTIAFYTHGEKPLKKWGI